MMNLGNSQVLIFGIDKFSPRLSAVPVSHVREKFTLTTRGNGVMIKKKQNGEKPSDKGLKMRIQLQSVLHQIDEQFISSKDLAR